MSGSLWFSLTSCPQTSPHCSVGIAVSCGSLVGLDVEESQRHIRADPLKLARRRLAPSEFASLAGGAYTNGKHRIMHTQHVFILV